MVKTQGEQVLKAQDDFLNEFNSKNNDNVVRVMTGGGKMTQEPLYSVGHPKRAEQDTQRLILIHLVLLIKRKRIMIRLCMLLLNLL